MKNFNPQNTPGECSLRGRRHCYISQNGGCAVISRREMLKFSSRREGQHCTDNLIAVAKKVNVDRFVAQGFAGSPYVRTGSGVKTEEDPFDPDPPTQFRATFAALRHLESSVLGSFPERGIVLRYGWFYGPRTSLAKNGPMAQAVRQKNAERADFAGRLRIQAGQLILWIENGEPSASGPQAASRGTSGSSSTKGGR
jgi:hypothetical protein